MRHALCDIERQEPPDENGNQRQEKAQREKVGFLRICWAVLFISGGEVLVMRKKENFRVVENVVVTAAPQLSARLALTTIAILAVVGAVLIKAILLGEFNWLGGG